MGFFFCLALSIAVVPLAVFYLNLAGMRISLLSSSLTVLGIVAVSGAAVCIKNLYWYD